ncbi:MAG: tetratricopeptide repeat protein [Myxococcota bacterium]
MFFSSWFQLDPVESHEKLAEAARKAGDLVGMCRHYSQALQAARSRLGEHHPRTGELYCRLGILYHELRRLDECEPLLRRGLDILSPDGTNERSMLIGRAHHGLGAVHMIRGEHDPSLFHLRRRLELCRAVNGEQDLRTAACYVDLGVAYTDKGDNTAAIDTLRKALKIRTELLNDKHQLVGRVHYYLGHAYLNKQSFDSAVRYMKHGLAICANAMGEDHYSLSVFYVTLAMAYAGKGNYRNAVAAAKRCVAIRKSRAGEDHPSTKEARKLVAWLSRGAHDPFPDFNMHDLCPEVCASEVPHDGPYAPTA